MEKLAEQERPWLWQHYVSNASDGAHVEMSKHYTLATFWPCGIYSRTSSRLRTATGGHDATYVPDDECCNSDCTHFGLCIPFYGFFLAALQTNVRSFYNIPGSVDDDCYDGCCCPGLTLVRAEHEILLREIERLENERRPGRPARRSELGRSDDQYSIQAPMSLNDSLASLHRLGSPVGSSKEQYRSHPPMLMGSPASSTSAVDKSNEEANSKKGKSKGKGAMKKSKRSKEPERVWNDLSTIDEAKQEQFGTNAESRETSHVSDEGRGEGSKKSDQGWATRFPIKYLGKEWFLVPANKENDDPSSPSEHTLPDDQLVTSGSSVVPHTLDDDLTLVADSGGSKFTEHLLSDDMAAAYPVPTIEISHLVESHSPIAQGKSASTHELSEDHGAPVSKARTGHSLEADDQISIAKKNLKHYLDAHEPIAVRPSRLPHPIGEHDEDEPVSPTSQSPQHSMGNETSYTVTHVLDDDVGGGVEGSQGTASATHDIFDDAEGSGISKPHVAAAHNLNNNAVEILPPKATPAHTLDEDAGESHQPKRKSKHDLKHDAAGSVQPTSSTAHHLNDHAGEGKEELKAKSTPAHDLNDDGVGEGRRISTIVTDGLTNDAIAEQIEDQTPGSWPSWLRGARGRKTEMAQTVKDKTTQE